MTELNDINNQPAPNPSPQERDALTQMVMALFDHWGLDEEVRFSLLGLPDATPEQVLQYRAGHPLQAGEPLSRASLLLSIHKNVRLLYPDNSDLAYTWMSKKNKAFDNRTPIDWAAEKGLGGLIYVREYLVDVVEARFRGAPFKRN